MVNKYLSGESKRLTPVDQSVEIDPIIVGLLARLPKTGDVWPESERTLWIELLKGSFRLIYKDEDKRPMVQANLRSPSGKDEAANSSPRATEPLQSAHQHEDKDDDEHQS